MNAFSRSRIGFESSCRFAVFLLSVYAVVFSTQFVDAANGVEINKTSYDSLSQSEKNSIVTIELNSRTITFTNQTAVNVIYVTVQRKVIEYLNQNLTTTLSTTSATPSWVTVIVRVTPTTPTTTPTTTTFHPVDPRPARKRRQAENTEYKDENILFVQVIPAVKDEVLRLSLFIRKQGVPNPGDLLHSALTSLKNDGVLSREEGASVTNIYKGIPEDQKTTSAAGRFFWSLPVQIAIFLFTTFCVNYNL